AAIERLSGNPDGRHKALHDTRKGMKRLRALMRLLRAGDDDYFSAQNKRFQAIAASLSAARDAGALVETVDRFADGGNGEIEPFRTALVARRDRIVEEDDAAGSMIADAKSALEEAIAAAGA